MMLWKVCWNTAFRLQPSINLHAAVAAFMFSCSGREDARERDAEEKDVREREREMLERDA